MTFDVSIYRKYVKDPSIDTRMCLSDALDEIERLQRDVDGLTTALAGSGKTVIIESATQAKRIAELEASAKRAQSIISGDLGYIEAANRKMEKQRAALKKLGEKVRVRGKALVEERAHCYLNLERNADIVPWDLNEVSENEQKRLRYDAREQLRREGKP